MTHRVAAYASLAEVYGTGQYAPFLRAMRSAGTVPIALVRFSQPAGAFPDPPTADFTLAMNECGSGRMSFDIGLGRRCQSFRRSDLVLKPPAVATYFANDASHQKCFLSLPARMVHSLAAELGATAAAGMPDFGRLHEGVFRSRMISQLLDMIWAEAMADVPQGRLFIDGAVLAIVATLQKIALPTNAEDRPAAGLSAPRLARLSDWVEAHLACSFGLAEMAGGIGLSPYHFSRAFKLATGLTPRAYVCPAYRPRQGAADGRCAAPGAGGAGLRLRGPVAFQRGLPSPYRADAQRLSPQPSLTGRRQTRAPKPGNPVKQRFTLPPIPCTSRG